MLDTKVKKHGKCLKIHQDTRVTRYFTACGLYTWQNKVSRYYRYHLFIKCKCLFCWQVYSAVPCDCLYLWKSNQYQSNLHHQLHHKASKQDLKAHTVRMQKHHNTGVWMCIKHICYAFVGLHPEFVNKIIIKAQNRSSMSFFPNIKLSHKK